MTPIDALLWLLVVFVAVIVLAIIAALIGAFVDAFRKRKTNPRRNDHKIL